MTPDSIESLKNQANKLRHSSNFTAGDPGSFVVPIVKGQVELPGKYDPATYLDKLELRVLDNLAVVFPGNGGLCAEAVHRGASTVWAIEPRNQFNKAITSVSGLMVSAGKAGFSILTKIEDGTDLTGDGKFDVIVWSEGLDLLSNPAESIKNIFSMVKPGGRMFIEVTHGTHEIPKSSVNSWKPKEEAFVTLVNSVVGPDISLRAMKGRLDKRIIYEITKTSAKVTEAVKLAEPVAPAPTSLQAVRAEIERVDQIDLITPIKRPKIKKIPLIKKEKES